MAIAVLARRAEGNADLMEIQRDYVGLRGEICSPLKYRVSLRKGVGPKLAGDERYGRENVLHARLYFALSRRKQWFESTRERGNINHLGGIPKTTFRRDQTSTKD
jgi:hypothetical protein